MEKRKFKLIRLLIILAVLVVIIVAAIIMVKNKGKDNENPVVVEENSVIDLPDTKYSDMEVGNIEMEYLTSK